MRFNLHRLEKGNEWDSVKKSDRSIFQNIAANTNGIITPGNILSFVGLLISVLGINLIGNRADILIGVVLILLGRLFDIADGYAADKTATKSSLGEIVDATFDKIVLFYAVYQIWQSGLAPKYVLLITAALWLFNALVSLASKYKNIKLHPDISGKIATIFTWIYLCGFPIAELTKDNNLHDLISLLSYICFFIYLPLAVISSYRYLSIFLKNL